MTIRPLGKITTDLEKVIHEMTEDHDMQWGEIFNLIRGYLEVHCPDSREEYLDGTNPVFYYGDKK